MPSVPEKPSEQPPEEIAPRESAPEEDDELADIREAGRYGDALWAVFGRIVEPKDPTEQQ